MTDATETKANPDRRCRLFVPIRVGKTAVFSRGGKTAVLTVVRSDPGKGAAATLGDKVLWLPLHQLRSVYFEGTRVGLFLVRALDDLVRVSIEAPQHVQVRRPHDDGGRGDAA